MQHGWLRRIDHYHCIELYWTVSDSQPPLHAIDPNCIGLHAINIDAHISVFNFIPLQLPPSLPPSFTASYSSIPLYVWRVVHIHRENTELIAAITWQLLAVYSFGLRQMAAQHKNSVMEETPINLPKYAVNPLLTCHRWIRNRAFSWTVMHSFTPRMPHASRWVMMKYTKWKDDAMSSETTSGR